MITRGVVEGAMLEVLAAQGLECNPSTQLVSERSDCDHSCHALITVPYFPREEAPYFAYKQ